MMTRYSRWPRAALAIAVSVLIVLAACGDSDDGNDNAGTDDDTTSDEVAIEDPEPTVTVESDEAESTEVPESTDDVESVVEEESVQQPSMQWDQPPEMQLEDGANYQAVITTNRGEVVVNLLQDDAPLTVNSFVFLSGQGFYQNVPFHRVINGFMIQTGDPTGTGAGGPGYRFEDEPVTHEYTPGAVAMANAGPDTKGPQFFIVHGDLRGQLPPNYTIFGEVVDGMNIVDEIANVPVQPSRTGEMSSPTEDVFIESVEIRK
jgi:cyclophilin family peptidyl-prolyl cis-trans isomerase